MYNGNDGILSVAQPGTLMIDSSTIDLDVSQEVYKLAKDKGSNYIDAPVSGGLLDQCNINQHHKNHL